MGTRRPSDPRRRSRTTTATTASPTCSSATGSRQRRDEALETHPEWYPDGIVPRPTWRTARRRPSLRPTRSRRAHREDALREGVPDGPPSARPTSRADGCSRRSSTGTGARPSPQWWDYYRACRGGAGGPRRGWRRARRTCGSRPTWAGSTAPAFTATGSIRHRTRRCSRARRTSRSRRTPTGPAGTTCRRASSPSTRSRGGSTSSATATSSHPVALIPSASRTATEPMRKALLAPRGRRHRARDLGAGPAPRGTRPGAAAAAPRSSASSRAPRWRPRASDVTALSPATSRCASTRRVLAIQGPPGTGKTYTAHA